MTIWSSRRHSTTSRLSRSTWLCQEPCCGEWDSEEDFTRHIVEECYNLEKMMGNLANYFDYKAFLPRKRQSDDGHELFMYVYQMGANNNVFRVI
ncbi:MAG: antirestriction protein ArdA [Duncaniella sp.]|nr:antirestriction protein ArdA [Duncaniella sp.]